MIVGCLAQTALYKKGRHHCTWLAIRPSCQDKAVPTSIHNSTSAKHASSSTIPSKSCTGTPALRQHSHSCRHAVDDCQESVCWGLQSLSTPFFVRLAYLTYTAFQSGRSSWIP